MYEFPYRLAGDDDVAGDSMLLDLVVQAHVLEARVQWVGPFLASLENQIKTLFILASYSFVLRCKVDNINPTGPLTTFFVGFSLDR